MLRALLLGSCSLFVACSERALLQDASGRYRLVARCDGRDADGPRCRELLRRAGEHATILCHDERMVRAAATSTPNLHIVAIGGAGPDAMFAPTDAPEMRRLAAQTAVVLDETGADAAIDLALLWCHGIAPPSHLPLGTRILRSGVPDAAQPAPGDFVLELLRRQHGDLLTSQPNTDVVFRIGCAVLRADGRHLRVRDQARAAAARYPQLELVDRAADGDRERLAAIVRTFLDDGHRAILVSTDDTKSLAPIAAAARERNVALFVLDAFAECDVATCCIGCDQQVLGRAAGEAVRQLEPGGAAIVEIGDDLQRPAIRLREQGLAAALGLQQP